VDGAARCVDDPSECSSNDDCGHAGWECRDWLGTGARFCWSPASTCFDDLSCYEAEFCEDPEGDWTFTCVLHEGSCVVARDECRDLACVDDNGDGRGTCQ
jgi:hypothetical protein